MTMPLEERFVTVDPDQDTADDERNHYTHACFTDLANWGSQRPVVAWCGEWFITQGQIWKPWESIPGLCQECEQALYSGKPCPRGCGWVYGA